jgi:fatty-acyl-CoA synthase
MVFDSYGQSEGGANVWRTPDTPPSSLGPAPEGVAVLNPETGREAPRARFDDAGQLLNAEEAIGELVNKNGLSAFEGYWRNDEATAQRSRGGYYWSGDLAYRDERGFLYFAGRDYDWLRVDGENFAAVPVENILCRHPDVVLAAAFAVPAEDSGDDVMCVLELRPEAAFDPVGFEAFLALQPDLGTKWAPRFVRISTTTPLTETTKVVKRQLRGEYWETADPVWWRPTKDSRYVPLTAQDRESLTAKMAARGQLL